MNPNWLWLIVPAAILIFALLVCRALEKMSADYPTQSEPRTEEIPQFLPMFGKGNIVLYYRGNYPVSLQCMDPLCADPTLTDGQAVEIFPAGGKHLAVCLDCMDRNTKAFARGME